MTSISEVNSEWVAFKHRSDHGFQITHLPDYLSMCLLKAFVILNTSFNYGLSKLVMYSLTTDPETSWVNYSFIIQITTNAKLMEIIHRNIQSIYPAARTVLFVKSSKYYILFLFYFEEHWIPTVVVINSCCKHES